MRGSERSGMRAGKVPGRSAPQLTSQQVPAPGECRVAQRRPWFGDPHARGAHIRAIFFQKGKEMRSKAPHTNYDLSRLERAGNAE
jgi:hypothetical protein